MRPCSTIKINTENLSYNVKTLLSTFPDYKYYIGVVKGNAYGHSYSIIRDLISSGINYLAVSTLEEASSVRIQNQDIPILCLQPIHLDDLSFALNNNITLTISSYDYFTELIKRDIKQKLKIHIKVDSGLHRLGLSNKNQIEEIITTLKNHPYIILEGIYTHFATTGVMDKQWDDQLLTFKRLTSSIDLSQIPIVHLGRSLTLINHKKIDFCNGIRIGTIMYGYYRSSYTHSGIMAYLRNIKGKLIKIGQGISPTITKFPFTLKPALTLESEIFEIKKIKKGDLVGYGGVYKADNDCILGIVSIGYADGFNRRNRGGYVSINGKKYTIISVDMKMLTILIDSSIKLFDKVELIGENVSITNVARQNNTTVYEILCSLKEYIPRILI
jgi:alanine racemase